MKEPSVGDAAAAASPLDKEISDFNREVALMLQRIDAVTIKFSPSSHCDMEVITDGAYCLLQDLCLFLNFFFVFLSYAQQGEIELALLEPDVATLISRGDGLVLRVQTDDMERALQINATTAELRLGRTTLKAAHEVINVLSKAYIYYFLFSPPGRGDPGRPLNIFVPFFLPNHMRGVTNVTASRLSQFSGTRRGPAGPPCCKNKHLACQRSPS